MAGHYLIADASGKSVLVEYYDNELQIVETDSNYQIASNFIAYNGVNIGGEERNLKDMTQWKKRYWTTMVY